MAGKKRRDSVIKSLSVQANQDLQDSFALLNNMQPIVMSCGGIYIPHQRLTDDVKNWSQIVNIPGDGMQASVFGFSGELPNPLDMFLFRESSN